MSTTEDTAIVAVCDKLVECDVTPEQVVHICLFVAADALSQLTDAEFHKENLGLAVSLFSDIYTTRCTDPSQISDNNQVH